MMSSYLQLFLSFLKLGLLSIGGGYAIMPLIQEFVVSQQGWISAQEFSDIITISQMTPGPLAVNTATFVGIRIHGLSGALVATLGTVIGGVIISILLYHFFMKYESITMINNVLEGLKSCSTGLIASAAGTILLMTFFKSQSLELNLQNFNLFAFLVFIGTLYFLRKYKLNPILVLVVTGCLGLFIY